MPANGPIWVYLWPAARQGCLLWRSAPRGQPLGLGRPFFLDRILLLLYVDESGSLENPGDHFVLGAVAIHESDVESLRRRVEGIVRKYLDQHIRGIELHAHSIRTGGSSWGRIPRQAKQGLLRDLPKLLGAFKATTRYALFSVARAPNAVPAADPLQRCFEELFLRFHERLQRLTRADDPNLGIVVADKAKYESILQPVVQQWRDSGTRFGRVRNIVEVPLFVDSRATRMIQLADMVAYATYRYYQAGDDALFAPLLPAFDTEAGVIHGLVHLVPRYRSCPCPACVSRQTAAQLRSELGLASPITPSA